MKNGNSFILEKVYFGDIRIILSLSDLEKHFYNKS